MVSPKTDYLFILFTYFAFTQCEVADQIKTDQIKIFKKAETKYNINIILGYKK